MRRALPAFALLGATCAAAQTVNPSRSFPLGDGDVWLYRYDRSTTPAVGAPVETVLGLAEMRVDGDTLIEGGVWKRLRLRQFTLAGVETARNTSAAQYDLPSSWVYIRRQAATSNNVTGTPGSLLGQRLVAVDSPQDLLIGGTVHRVRGTYQSSHMLWSDGLDRPTGECNWTYIAGEVGMTGYDCTSRAGLPYIYEQSRLVYARVGGRVYGVNLVAGEAGPEPSAPRALRAYPVPARHTVTVEADEATTVDVFDALGRRVATGEVAPRRPLRLDVSAWPAGVYVARDAAGRSARLVVAR